ncbi:hypothetical protein BDK51DRAFT_25933 [Blyttiomyces helicus]|uniref:Leucine Rich repeats (2 copies) n=1 Tax=Blyttiomyces helicus TaxID=388810 RepID=A0A4P9VXE2_9FUNG|nr:hypothetical protein BDK51DRAFT_25933 [Blyttiomyces helicus]|eukprot:RKO83912.1 hypothetical protein BDK51DRAFT_25933 [Blyttiomyces helicus]
MSAFLRCCPRLVAFSCLGAVPAAPYLLRVSPDDEYSDAFYLSAQVAEGVARLKLLLFSPAFDLSPDDPRTNRSPSYRQIVATGPSLRRHVLDSGTITSNDAFTNHLRAFPIIDVIELERIELPDDSTLGLLEGHRPLQLLRLDRVDGVTEDALIRLLRLRGSALTHLYLIENDWVTDATIAALSDYALSLDISGSRCSYLEAEQDLIVSATLLQLLCLAMRGRNLRMIDTGCGRDRVPEGVMTAFDAAGVRVGTISNQYHRELAEGMTGLRNWR